MEISTRLTTSKMPVRLTLHAYSLKQETVGLGNIPLVRTHNFQHGLVEELKETKEKLDAAESFKNKLQERVKQLEYEASILNRDILASDRDTKRAARLVDPADESTGLDTSMSISRASKGSAALEEITELEDDGLTRRSAVIEVANLVMQRDLRMVQSEKTELNQQLKRAEDQKKELEDIILSLRQEIALADVNVESSPELFLEVFLAKMGFSCFR